MSGKSILKFPDEIPERQKWFHNLVLQFNSKDAENTAINKLAKKGTHTKRAIVKVPMNRDGKELYPEVTIKDFELVIAEGV